MVAEYPSHLPPGVEVVEGIDADDRTFVCDSLRALFYRERAEVAEDEPPEGIVHKWTEWLQEEWIAASG